MLFEAIQYYTSIYSIYTVLPLATSIIHYKYSIIYKKVNFFQMTKFY